MPAVPVAEVMQGIKDPVTKGVLKIFAEESEILRWMKFKVVKGITLETSIDASLPVPFYAGINAEIAASDYVHGTSRLAKDTVSRLVVPIKVDNIWEEVEDRWEDEAVRQSRQGAEAAARTFNSQFFLAQGGLGAGLQEPIGAYRRLAAGVSSLGGDGTIPEQQLINCSGPLTMSKLDRLCDAVPSGSGITRVLFMNVNLRRKISALMRDPSYRGLAEITIGKDDFGMQVEMYNGVRIAVIEQKENYYSALSSSETTTGIPTLGTGTSGTASIWCMAFGDERGVYGFGPKTLGFTLAPFVQVPGQLYKVSLSPWLYAYVTYGPRDMARLYNISYEADSD